MKTTRDINLQAIAITLFCLVFTACTDTLDPPVDPQPDPTEEEQPHTTIQAPVSRGGTDSGTVDIRYYDDMPGVAYISVADFQKIVLPGSTVKVQKIGDGLYQLDNGMGTAVVNTAAETFVSDNYMDFTNQMTQLWPGMANVYWDGSPYLHYESMALTPATATVSFDFKKYGIDLRGNGQTVYFPFATLSDMYSDIYYHLAAFNGERVFFVTSNANSQIVDIDPKFVETAMNHMTRTPEQAAYEYGELCFVVDHFYGKPGRAAIENSLHSKGLDATLDEIQYGKEIKQLLQSTDMAEYLYGMSALQPFFEDGGHTRIGPMLDLVNTDQGISTTMPDKYKQVGEEHKELKMMIDEWTKSRLPRFLRMFARMAQRKTALPGELYYRKKGDTAFCIFDQFGPTDLNGWEAYYAGRAPMPTVLPRTTGELVIILDALKRADEDPEVKNFVIDVTNNPGGSLDVVMAVTSLVADKSEFFSENVLTGQRQAIRYAVDRNFDGKWDEKDREVNYNLNFAVLTSERSFSCGNLFSSLMKDLDYPIIGEKSGGGACAVQYFCTPGGLQYQISSSRARLTDNQWRNIDGGIDPHVSIALGTPIDGYPNYTEFYNLDRLSSIINDWYAAK